MLNIYTTVLKSTKSLKGKLDMKFRSGFVSNSSSSSFIVGLPKVPASVEELKEMMFGKQTEVTYYDTVMSCNDIAKRVYDDITSGKASALNKSKAIKVVEEGTFPGYPERSWNVRNKKSDAIREAYREEHGKDLHDEPANSPIMKKYDKVLKEEFDAERALVDAAAKAFLEGFWPSMKGTKPFRFEYADDSGEAVLEHGNIFRKFPHVRISKH